METEDRQHLEKLLQTYKRRLRVLEEQEANTGPRTPPEIRTELDDLRKQIIDVTSKLPNITAEKATEAISHTSENPLVILYEDNIGFKYTGGHLGLPQSFACALNCYINNDRDRPVVLQSFSYKIGVNDIFDEFLMKRIGLVFSVSKPLKGSLAPDAYSRQYSDKFTIGLPLVVQGGSILPLTLFLQIDIKEYLIDGLVDICNWIKKLNIIITYKFLENSRTKEDIMSVSVDCKQLRGIAADVASTYRVEQKKNPNR